jgi:hypothetical protein
MIITFQQQEHRNAVCQNTYNSGSTYFSWAKSLELVTQSLQLIRAVGEGSSELMQEHHVTAQLIEMRADVRSRYWVHFNAKIQQHLLDGFALLLAHVRGQFHPVRPQGHSTVLEVGEFDTSEFKGRLEIGQV